MPTEIRYQETTANAEDRAGIDDAIVRAYFDTVGEIAPTASYMGHERDMPRAAMRYRFAREKRLLEPWLRPLDRGGRVLDVGCGSGRWTAYFADRFATVVGIDRSAAMIRAARDTCADRANVELHECDFRKELPEGPFELIFLGGICMYLGDADAEAFLCRLASRLTAHGVIVCRESTVRRNIQAATGTYQALYRSVERYIALFESAGIPATRVTWARNDGYDAMNIAGEVVLARRHYLPFLPKVSPMLGAATWWALRLTAPLGFVVAPKLAAIAGIDWPRLSNHFFLLRSPAEVQLEP